MGRRPLDRFTLRQCFSRHRLRMRSPLSVEDLERRIDITCAFPRVVDGRWGRRSGAAFWISAAPRRRQLLRPVFRGAIVTSAEGVELQGTIRPIAIAAVCLLGPILLIGAVVFGVAGAPFWPGLLAGGLVGTLAFGLFARTDANAFTSQFRGIVVHLGRLAETPPRPADLPVESS